MIDSAILRTSSVQMLTLNCQVRWSARLCGDERNFSNEGFSIPRVRCLRSLGAGIEVLGEERAKIEFVERIRGGISGNFLDFLLQERFVGIAVGWEFLRPASSRTGFAMIS